MNKRLLDEVATTSRPPHPRKSEPAQPPPARAVRARAGKREIYSGLCWDAIDDRRRASSRLLAPGPAPPRFHLVRKTYLLRSARPVAFEIVLILRISHVRRKLRIDE